VGTVRQPPRPGELDSYFDSPAYKTSQMAAGGQSHVGARRQFGGLGEAVAGGAVAIGIDKLLKDDQP
jgi:hypothetical protein